MRLLRFLFGSGENKTIPEPKPDPIWMAARQREQQARQQLQARRARSIAEAQHHRQASADSQIRYENSLIAVQQHPRQTTSQIDLPAIKLAIRQTALQRTITRVYSRPDRISLFEFFNGAIASFIQETGYCPTVIRLCPRQQLPAYDQHLLARLPGRNSYHYQFMSLQILEDIRLCPSQIWLEGICYV